MRPHGADRAGLTLVEMLVVLAIVGISAGGVVLAAGSVNGAAPARTEAELLAGRLRLAADEVLILGQPVTARLAPSSYVFDTPQPAEWSGRHVLTDGVRLVAAEADLIIDPDGAQPPVVISLRDGRTAWAVAFDGLNARVSPAEAS